MVLPQVVLTLPVGAVVGDHLGQGHAEGMGHTLWREERGERREGERRRREKEKREGEREKEREGERRGDRKSTRLNSSH